MIEHLLKQLRDYIERDIDFRDEDRYHLSDPRGGGYAKSFTLEEVLDEALWLTSDECRAHRALVIDNIAHQVIAIVYDERVFTPIELHTDWNVNVGDSEADQ